MGWLPPPRAPGHVSHMRCHDGGCWAQAGIEEFESKEPADVIFSNAALHWVPNHRSLLPQLMKQLKPGGVFAMQIPDTRR